MTLTLPKTPFIAAIRRLIQQIDATIDAAFAGPLTAFVVGGVAVHIYTSTRISTDFDAKFVPGLLLSHEHVVRYSDRGEDHFIRLDRNYMEVLALMHPDWEIDAREAERIGRILLKIISPLDLAVSKVARFADNDRDDIRSLAMLGLLDADKFETRSREALDYYVGETVFVRHNLADAAALIRASRPAIP